MDAGAETKLQTCLALRAAGDLSGALDAARAAATDDPASPVPHYAQGELLTALHDEEGAVLAYVEALRRAPGWADAWINLGLARYRQGGVGAAKLAFREALRLAPGHAAATANLAALLRLTGGAREAEALLRAALTSAPANAAARLNLVGVLLQRARGAEALALLDAAAPPEDVGLRRQWFLAQALAALQQARPGLARAALAQVEALGPTPPDLAPLLIWRRVLLAQVEGDAARAALLIPAMQVAVAAMGPGAVPEHRIMAHYDLASYFIRHDNAAAAFAHWGEAHACLRKLQPFDRDDLRRFVETAMDAFPAARFAPDAPRARNRDPAPVFIVGMPRSGTTLCEQILAAHHDVHGAGERAELYDLVTGLAGERWAGINPRLAALDAETLEREAAAYLHVLHALAPDKARIVDKMPGNDMYLGLIGLLLPGARIIHCTRDPRDIGFSIWTFRFHGEHGYAHDLADLGWTIGQRARLMAHWRAVLPNPILTVALQDWVHDFHGTLARVLRFLDLPDDPACDRFYELDRDVMTVSREQVRQPVNARGLGRWRPHAQRLAPMIAELEVAGLLR